MQEFQTLEEEAIQDESMLEVPTPPTKDWSRTTDMSEGEYIFRRFDSTTFCCAQCTILFLEPVDENREPTTDIETSTYGYFLEKEIEQISVVSMPLRPANLSMLRRPALSGATNPSKKKRQTFFHCRPCLVPQHSPTRDAEEQIYAVSNSLVRHVRSNQSIFLLLRDQPYQKYAHHVYNFLQLLQSLLATSIR